MSAVRGLFTLRCPSCGWATPVPAKTLGVALFGLHRHSCDKRLEGLARAARIARKQRTA